MLLGTSKSQREREKQAEAKERRGTVDGKHGLYQELKYTSSLHIHTHTHTLINILSYCSFGVPKR